MKNLLVIFIACLSLTSFSQQEQFNGDSASFDFWVGEWDALWYNADNSVGKGENIIYKTLNDKVIFENFKVLDGENLKGFEGKSFSVFNPLTKIWKQTWVDNAGAYLEFIGEVHSDKKIFKREITTRDNRKIAQRMVFYNFKEDSFTWDWESSNDGGETWKLQWRIYYTRKK